MILNNPWLQPYSISLRDHIASVTYWYNIDLNIMLHKHSDRMPDIKESLLHADLMVSYIQTIFIPHLAADVYILLKNHTIFNTIQKN